MRGFTLIEMLVVSAIILVITTFVFLQQGKFNSATLLRSLVYSVALSARQAQVYSTSVRGVSSGVSTAFGGGYGIYFPGVGDPAGTTYYMFVDSVNGDGVRAAGGSEDLVPPSPYVLGKGYYVSKFCVRSGAATAICSDDPTPITTLTIFFRRTPDACFSTSAVTNTCAIGATQLYSAAYIQLKSAGNGDTRSLKITSTGQIAVCTPNLADITAC